MPTARRQARLVADACRTIAGADGEPSLATLAASAGLAPHRFHRLFKATTGVTPHAYASALRAARVREALVDGRSSVTDAIHAAGFNAAAPFYAQSDALLGMTPGAYRAGGRAARIAYAIAPCTLGHVLVAGSARGICAIALGDDPQALLADLRTRFHGAQGIAGDAAFAELVAQVVALVDAPARAVALPLDIQGTAFQQRVWQALRAIPAGSTATYLQIAQRIGAPTSARAVAAACAANTLAVAIPCHRVLRGDGSLSGYRWGPARKRALLDAEAEAGAKD